MKKKTIRCQYCDCKISDRDAENEEGICPECGQPLMNLESSLFGDYDDGEDDDRDRDPFNTDDDPYEDEDDLDGEDYEDEDDDIFEAEYAPRRNSSRNNRSSDDY